MGRNLRTGGASQSRHIIGGGSRGPLVVRRGMPGAAEKHRHLIAQAVVQSCAQFLFAGWQSHRSRDLISTRAVEVNQCTLAAHMIFRSRLRGRFGSSVGRLAAVPEEHVDLHWRRRERGDRQAN